MSWSLIKSIQKQTNLRLILPFGLNLYPGDVISVGRDGSFTLEGSCESLLDILPGNLRQPQDSVDLMTQFGENTHFSFREAGKASSLFPELPSAQAGIDISLGSADSWLLALRGLSINSLENTNRFRRPMLEANRWGVWQPDWALVTSTAKVDRMTLLTSSSSNTKIALSIEANVASNANSEILITSNVKIAATNQKLFQCISTKPMTAFCSALRIKDSGGWWRDPYINTLDSININEDKTISIDDISDEEFWEDIDVI